MTDAALPGAPLMHAPTPVRQPTASPDAQHVAQEFESIFIAEMLAPMFEGLDTEGLGGGGAGESMFRPMLIQQYAAALAKNGGIGLADSVVRELARMQAAQTAPADDNGPDR